MTPNKWLNLTGTRSSFQRMDAQGVPYVTFRTMRLLVAGTRRVRMQVWWPLWWEIGQERPS